MGKNNAEEERTRRKEVEAQLLALQAERQATAAAAAKLNEDKDKKASKYEAECAALKAELDAMGKNHKTTSSQGNPQSACLY